MKRTKYLTGNELLTELHKCKITFGTYTDEGAKHFDIAVGLGETLSLDTVAQRCEAIGKTIDEVVIRHMTYDLIPIDPDRKRNDPATGERHTKTDFPPFRHYRIRAGAFVEVGRSHWCGSFENGHFCPQQGRISDKLAGMFLKMAERYALKANFRGYSYREEMIAEALMNLCQNGLRFDESKSNNPFAYYTRAIHNSFLKYMRYEKKHQSIRDDLIEQSGFQASHTRQAESAH